jgi:predicted nucleic acid-binding protein
LPEIDDAGKGQKVLVCLRLQEAESPAHEEVRTFAILAEELGRLSDWLASHGVTHVAIGGTNYTWAPIQQRLQEAFTVLLIDTSGVTVSIAVMDLGIGFRGSLAREHAARYGDRWNDATALEAAFIHHVTRFRDPGRGQGLRQIRRSVSRWDGKVSIRSGTARIAAVPEWDDAAPLQIGLAPFPGAQIQILLPARAGESPSDDR